MKSTALCAPLACLLAALAGPTALAGGVQSILTGPPISAAIMASQPYPAVGDPVTFAATDGKGGPPSDEDSVYVDGAWVANVEDSLTSIHWAFVDPDGAIVFQADGNSVTWTPVDAQGANRVGVYTARLSVRDGGSGHGSGALDGTTWRTFPITVSTMAPPTFRVARAADAGQISLEWDPPQSGAVPTSYMIYRHLDGVVDADPVVVPASAAINGHFVWADTSAAAGMTYDYHIVPAGTGTTGPSTPVFKASADSVQASEVAYVANSGNNTVMVLDLDPQNPRVIATIAIPAASSSVGVGPLGITASPDGARVFVTNFLEETVSTIDCSTNKESGARIPLRGSWVSSPSWKLAPDGIATPDGKKVFAADAGGVSLTTNNGNTVAFDWPGALEAINTAATPPTIFNYYGSGGFPTHPRKIAMTPDNTQLVVTDVGMNAQGQNAVWVCDITAQGGLSPTTLAPFYGSISLPTWRMPGGQQPRPQGVATLDVGGRTYAFAANTTAQSVSVVDLTSSELELVIPLSGLPSNGSYSYRPPCPMEVSASGDCRYVFIAGSQQDFTAKYHSVIWIVDTNVVNDSQAHCAQYVHGPYALHDGAFPAMGAGRIAVALDTGPSGMLYRACVTNMLSNNVSVIAYDGVSLTENALLSTGPTSMPGGIAIRPATAVVPGNLRVAATGPAKLTLYWQAVPGAMGYQIYRGGTSGGENYASPLSQVTPPVVCPTDDTEISFNDIHVTNYQQYYYTVKAVFPTGVSRVSNEATDEVDPGAVPWDTRDTAQILDTFEYLSPSASYPLAALGDTGTYSPASEMAIGPDGTVYERGQAPRPSDGSLEPGTNQINMSDGTVSTASSPWYPPQGGDLVYAPPNGAAVSIHSTDGGAYRRIQTSPGYAGAAMSFQLPNGVERYTYTWLNAQGLPKYYYVDKANKPKLDANGNKVFASTGDIPHIYLGCQIGGEKMGDGSQVDAGVMYNSGQFNWSPFVNLNGKLITASHRFSPNVGVKIVFDILPRVYDPKFKELRSQNLSLLVFDSQSVRCVRMNGFLAAANGPGVQMKRMYTIAQTFPKVPIRESDPADNMGSAYPYRLTGTKYLVTWMPWASLRANGQGTWQLWSAASSTASNYPFPAISYMDTAHTYYSSEYNAALGLVANW